MVPIALEFEALMPLPVRDNCCLVLSPDEREDLDFMLTVTHDPEIVVLAAPPPGVPSGAWCAAGIAETCG